MARSRLAALVVVLPPLAIIGTAACSKEQPAKPAPAPVKTEETVKEAPVENDIPIPPPEPVTPAPAATGSGSGTGTGAANGGPSGAANAVAKGDGTEAPPGPPPKICNGELTDDLSDGLSLKCKIARRCYETELASNPDLKGRVNVRVRIASDGSLHSPRVDSNETGDERLGSCVATMFHGKVPPPKDGCLETVVPCNFIRGGR